MRFGPAIGFIVLIAVAIAVAAISSNLHPSGGLPPAEQEAAQAQDDAQKNQKNQKPAGTVPKPSDPKRAAAFDGVKQGAVRATLEIEGKGVIVMEFYPKATPKTVAHIEDLIKKHFYDGIKIHRVEPGFVVQMGDPVTKTLSPDQFQANQAGSHGSGPGGASNSVPLEATLPHVQYSIGLARAQDPNSGDCQFYINLGDNASLDNNYCIFGRIVQGQDVAGKLAIGDTIKSFTLN